MSLPDAPDDALLHPRLLPPAVLALAARLHAAGHEAYLVGGCVRDTLRGQTVRDFDLTTSAPPETVLALVPRAIATGIRHGTVTVPTEAGMVDVTTYRAGANLTNDLAHRDFTVNAIALDPRTGALVDPWNGRRDLAAGVLRAVGSAAERLAEDPLRALRAARLVATLGLVPDPALEAALPGAREGLASVARERVRAELEALLCGAFVAEGLDLLVRSGALQRLVPGVRADAPAVVAALPADLALRLAALLRGTRAQAILAALRFPRRTARRAALLLRQHPLETDADSLGDTSLRRLLQRAGEENVAALIALRRAELGAAAAAVRAAPSDRAASDAGREPLRARPDPAADPALREHGATHRGASVPASDVGRDTDLLARLAAIEAGLARIRAAGALALHRFDLAIDGEGVMQALGCGPGHTVGAALRFLTERVLEDPGCNTPHRLRELLAGWTPPPERRLRETTPRGK